MPMVLTLPEKVSPRKSATSSKYRSGYFLRCARKAVSISLISDQSPAPDAIMGCSSAATAPKVGADRLNGVLAAGYCFCDLSVAQRFIL